MFEFLKNEKIKNVAPASHHVIQLIRGNWIQNTTQDFLALDGDTTLTPLQEKLVKRIVAEIEHKEGLSINKLPQKNIRKNVNKLTLVLEELSREQLHVDREKGLDLLEKIRRDVT